MSELFYLPRQGDGYSKPYSLDRDNQRGTELDAGLTARLPPGILAGGGITVSAALEIELEADTRVWTAGVRFDTGEDPLPLTVAGVPSGVVYVWGLLTRTAADQNTKTALDTYAFVLSYVADDPTPPSVFHVPLAVLPLDGSGNIDAANVNADPLGKRLCVGSRETIDGFWQDNVSASQTLVVLTRSWGGAAFGNKWIALRPGSITGVGVKSSAARAAGTLTVAVTKNGASVGLTAVLDGTNTVVKGTTQARGLDTFVVGDELSVSVTTSSDWSPTSADIRASLEVET